RHSLRLLHAIVFFFFQAEDGIRDFHVTGVQTCALPILRYGTILRHSITSFLSMKKGTRSGCPFSSVFDYPALTSSAVGVSHISHSAYTVIDPRPPASSDDSQ